MNAKEILVLCGLISVCLGFSPNRTAWTGEQPQLDVASAKAIEGASAEQNNATATRFPDAYDANQSDFIVKLIADSKDRVARESGKDNGPLNVIMLLIDGLDGKDLSGIEDAYFPVQGFLKGCSNEECDCEDLLRSKLVSLLSWAQHKMLMSTSTMYEIPAVYSRNMDVEQARRIERQLGQVPTDDHVTEVLRRMREAFFRSLVNSLNTGSGVHSTHEYQYHPRQLAHGAAQSGSEFHDLAERTLEMLGGAGAERGFALLSAFNVDELPGVLQLINRHVSPQNTLLIVAGGCPRSKSTPAAYFARGPGSERFASLNTLPEMPELIRTLIEERDETRDRLPRNILADSEKFDSVPSMMIEKTREEPSVFKQGEPIRIKAKGDGTSDKTPVVKTSDPPNDNNNKEEDDDTTGDLKEEGGASSITSNSAILFTIITVSVTYNLKY